MGGTTDRPDCTGPVRLHRDQFVTLTAVGALSIVLLVSLCWHLAASTPADPGESGSPAPAFVFVVGLLVTAGVLWLLRGHLQRREALRRSEALYRSLISDVLDASRVGIIILDADGRVVWLNEAFSAYFGARAGALRGADFGAVVRHGLEDGIVEDPEGFERHVLARADADAAPYEFHVLPGPSRRERWLEHRSQAIEGGLFAGGRIDQFYDVTWHKESAAEQSRLTQREGELQDQLRQSQRLEAVGKLAGGVAHDFNNILQVILGRAHQLLGDAPKGSRAAAWLNEVVEASEKAADLTRQLLAFGRRQHLERRLLEPNGLVRAHVKLLRRLIGEHIELELRLGEDVDHVRADRTQVEQVLMNLCVNARDAMPDGGCITIATESCREIAVPRPADTEVRLPESYVKLTVSDTGSGIPATDIDRVCEPFYTTKGPGKGSGLGLSTVHGIVHQHDGFIEIESFVGEGTSIAVYLPSVDETEIEETVTRTESPAQGSETILVVEDEPSVRSLAVEALGYGGYTVLTATDGEEGLEVLLAKADEIDLVFSDVVMPRMGGVALVEAARARGIDVPALLTSGYGEDTMSPHLDVSVLAKPYSPGVMLRKVRAVLDERRERRRLVAVGDSRQRRA